jgi:hypothetical protein
MGNYNTQYQIAFTSTGVGSDSDPNIVVTVDSVGKKLSDLPFAAWYDATSLVTYLYASPVADGTGKQYVWTSTTGIQTDESGSFNPTTGGTITGNYKTQYHVTVDWSGLGGDASGKVVTITVGGTDIGKNVGDSFYDAWLDSGTTVSYVFEDVVSSSVTGKRYKLVSVSGTSTDVSHDFRGISSVISESASYKTKYLVSFTQTGSAVAPTVTYTADTDPTGTVPFTVWVKASSEISYTYQGIVPDDPGVQYVLTGVDRDSPQTVNGPLTIEGTYKTQYYLTVNSAHDTPGGAGWYDSDSTAYATLTDESVPGGAELGWTGGKYVFTGWSGDGVGGTGLTSNGITMDKARTATANWDTIIYPPPVVTTSSTSTVSTTSSTYSFVTTTSSTSATSSFFFPTVTTTVSTVVTTTTIQWPQLELVSNSTILGLTFDPMRALLNFSVAGPAGSYGFIYATIPKSLLSGEPVVLIDGVETPASVSQDSDFWYIRVTYVHSQHRVIIGGSNTIPEFPSVPLFAIALMLASVIFRRRRER